MQCAILTWLCCTKGVASVRADHDGVGAAGRAAGRVAGRGAGEALPARAPRAVRRRPAAVGARHDARHGAHRNLRLRALRLILSRRNLFESQLGNSGRYIAGKKRLPRDRSGGLKRQNHMYHSG